MQNRDLPLIFDTQRVALSKKLSAESSGTGVAKYDLFLESQKLQLSFFRIVMSNTQRAFTLKNFSSSVFYGMDETFKTKSL